VEPIKWLAALGTAAIHGEMDSVSQQLTQRVKELAERYETSLPGDGHPCGRAGSQGGPSLETMGFEWK